MIRHADKFATLQGNECDFLEPRGSLALADWAETYRYVTQGPLVGSSGAPVPWRNDTFPLQHAVMDAIDSPDWRIVLIEGPPQAGGKTDCAAINVILKALHYDRRDCLYMSANSRKAADQYTKKFWPAMKASGELVRLIHTSHTEGGDKYRHDFTTSTSLFIAGAESIANISGSTIPVVVCDDVQAMPPAVGEMGHSCDIAWKRSAALGEEERTHVMLGTAGHTRDYLHRTLERSTYFRPYLPCPHCDGYQLLSWSRMVFDEEDPAKARADCRLRCEHCAELIAFTDLAMMLDQHKWVARGQSIEKGEVVGDMPKSTTAGFWWNALYWPFVEWGVYAAEWLESVGDPDKEKTFNQNVLTIPTEDPDEDTLITTEDVEKHALPGHRKGVVPAEADVLTSVYDVHDRFLYLTRRAWRASDGASWLIEASTIGVHTGKEDALTEAERIKRVGFGIRKALEEAWAQEEEGYPVLGPDGEILRVIKASVILVDGGYRPDAVWQSVRMFNTRAGRNRWFMTIGRSGRGKVKLVWPPKSTANKKTGHRYRELGVDEGKHLLSELLAIPPGQPGSWYTYADESIERYFRHMVSEEWSAKERDGKDVYAWRKRKGAGPNHWWDCETGQVAAAIAAKVRFIGHAKQKKKRRTRATGGVRGPDGRAYVVTQR